MKINIIKNNLINGNKFFRGQKIRQTALHLKTKVLPGHKIKIQSDNLEIGDTVFAEYIDFTLELIQL